MTLPHTLLKPEEGTASPALPKVTVTPACPHRAYLLVFVQAWSRIKPEVIFLLTY